MLPTNDKPTVQLPERRRLRAYAFDPMSTRLHGRVLTLDIPFERDLQPGPMGTLLHVVDYDATRHVWYHPVDLDHPALLAQGGMGPSERDPRTHQQIVYGVAMSVIERFERFLGRRFEWRGSKPLRLIPHAFEGRNAYFDPDRGAVVFGYFLADENPGPNLPRQVVFTCLSTDIIAHEVTHALVHRLRRYFTEATNPDVFAWHEAFADLVALFHHFAFPEIVAGAVATSQTELREADALLDLAKEFGATTARGQALRKAIDSARTPEAFANATEPHERGAYFVTAVFEAFLDTYKARIADLRRIASGGTGVLPAGALHPDLVNRVTIEAVRNADRLLSMVVRAFEYLPVVDVTFGDVVRAIVTVDRSLYPSDTVHLRGTLVESLRQRGIFPEAVTSLADEALAWPQPPELPGGESLTLAGDPLSNLESLIVATTLDLDVHGTSGIIPWKRIRQSLLAWSRTYADALGLDPGHPIEMTGAHVSYLTAADRQPRPIIVLQFMQRREDLEAERGLMGVPLRAACTVIARVDGSVEAIVPKPLPRSAPPDDLPEPIRTFVEQQHEIGSRRLEAILEFARGIADDDPLAAWLTMPSVLRLDFARVHAQDEDEPRPPAAAGGAAPAANTEART